jgi:hypothetical protein
VPFPHGLKGVIQAGFSLPGASKELLVHIVATKTGMVAQEGG